MTAKDYILKRLEGIKEKNTKPEKQTVDFIYATIMSKKFRKFSVNSEIQEKVRTAIKLNIEKNEPIKFVLPFGSYKLWRFEESPEVDWAELFAMIYYAYWLKPITDIYKPGVWFDFCADDAILELMNNIPPEDTEKYKQSFRVLIKFIQPYLPDNFKFTLSPVGERYSSKEEFLADLNDKMEKLKQKGEINLNERKIKMAEFNIKPTKEENTDFEKNRLLHDAYMNVEKRRGYHKTPDRISVCRSPFGGIAIPVGTTKTSIVAFQTGIGVLKKREENFIEYIMSPSQLENAKLIYEPISIDGLNGKNFEKIKILNASKATSLGSKEIKK